MYFLTWHVHFPYQVPAYFAGDEGTDESSTEDPSHRQVLFKSPSNPTASVVDRAPRLATPSRLLSDLDAGYADDIDEAEDDETLLSCSDKGHRKSRRHSRHHDSVDQSSNQVNRSPWSGCETALCDDDQDEPLVTPAMLISPPMSTFGPTGVDETTVPITTGRQSNKNTPPKQTSHRTSEISAEGSSLSTRVCNTSRDGLTKEQLREALIHIIQNDDDFLHRIHSAYIASLQRRILK
ncbi:unnamed protein product [Echinostoma caproni]|uniref:mRNA_decap_C domain-containing protein n=1 Tax=Echinostoma caproni TaxID=27848 RepID=A0A183B9I8_9TREM|nr:unnamed protein product [Echinostoma caproni]